MGSTILQPMLGMIVVTMIVWFVLYARRIPAMQRAGRPVQEYTTPERGVMHLPEQVNYASNNLKNLFELPVLFYALCLYLQVSGTATNVDIMAAWLFVGFRALHSAIHCTANIVMARFAAYCAATAALLFMLARAVWTAF